MQAKSTRGATSAGLTARQAVFVSEYLTDRNAAAAMRRAGYLGKNHSGRLMGYPAVAAAIRAGLQRIGSAGVMKATRVLVRLSIEAQSETNTARERIAALALLAKHHGLLVDRQERGAPGDFAGLTDTELDRQLLELSGRRVRASTAPAARPPCGRRQSAAYRNRATAPRSAVAPAL